MMFLRQFGIRSVGTPRVARGIGSSQVTVERATIASQQWSVATVLLHRPPVNSIDSALALELTRTLKEIEDSGEAKAIIIKSSLPKIFSAGLDLHELYGVSRSHLEDFWKAVQDLWLQIYSSDLVTLSFINGHC